MGEREYERNNTGVKADSCINGNSPRIKDKETNPVNPKNGSSKYETISKNRKGKKRKEKNKGKEVMKLDDFLLNSFEEDQLEEKEQIEESETALILWEDAQLPQNAIDTNNYEILAHLKDPKVSHFRDDIVSEPDIRVSNVEEEENQNFIIKDGKFHVFLKQSKDDHPSSNVRYPIISRRRRGSFLILMIKFIIWNIRGIGHPSKCRFLNSYCRDYKPDISAILEP